jgi:pimeloyl-ACP methyl ester carboxylesterase
MPASAASKEQRASNGIFFRIEGEGEPLLMLHGAMAAGAMFDPLIELLRDRFRMIIPDLRGHGKSGDLDGPYDVAALASDLDLVLAEARVNRCIVMGYSHGGAVAQQLAHTRPAAVSKLILACTYACNVSTLRERLECAAFLALLWFLAPACLRSSSFNRPNRSQLAPKDLQKNKPSGCDRYWPSIRPRPCVARLEGFLRLTVGRGSKR